MVSRQPHLPPISLGDWQAMVEWIYGEKDRRDYALSDMLLHVIGTFRGIAMGIRKESKEEVLAALPRTFIWLLSFCVMLGVDLERIVWTKYPGLCPYCGATQHCSCIAQQEKPAGLYRNEDGTPPSSLDEWQKMLERIYGRINSIVALTTIGFHFVEELAEVSRAFRFRDSEEGRQELEHEIADVFAWLLAFAIRYNTMLSTLAYDAYPGVCDTCKNSKCTCPRV